MATPVAMPVIVVLMQFYPGAGTAIPTPKEGNTSVMATYFTQEICEKERANKRVPEDFYCLEYRSEKFIDYKFPQDKSRQGSLDSVSVGPIALKEADKPYIEPLVEPALQTKPPARAARIAQRRPQQRHPQFDPLTAFVSLFTPRDY